MKGNTQVRTRFYVLQIIEDVTPELHGPYQTNDRRDRLAKQLRAADRNDLKDGLYRLDVLPNGELIVDTYRGGFLDPKGGK